GHLIIGKIHKRAHLSVVLKGKIAVATEEGPRYYEAPCVFVSEAGVKRAGWVVEDTLWMTVHLTEKCGEEKLDEIEQELIAPTYEEFDELCNGRRSLTEPAR